MKDASAPNLRGFPLFSGLSIDACRYLQVRLHRLDFPAGTCVIQQGKRGQFMAIIGRGLVELKSHTGQTQIYQAGQSFGEGMLRYDVPSSFTATALEDTILWVLLRRDWLAVQSIEVIDRPVGTKREPRGGWRRALVLLAVLVTALLVLGQDLLDFTHKNLTRMAMIAGRPDLAAAYLEYAILWQPTSNQLYNDLGAALFRQGKSAEALAAFQKAAALDESSALAQNNLGVALFQQAKPAEAVKHLQIAVKLDPGSAEALYNLGNAHLAAGDPASAAKAYQRAYDLDAGQLDARALWAGLALQAGQVDQARAAWMEVLAVEPGHPLAHKGLGAVAVLEGDPVQALLHLAAARDANPQDATIRFFLGLAWETLERGEEAAIEFEQALLLSDDLALKSLVEAHLQFLRKK